MAISYNDTKALLAKHHQSHVLSFWDKLNPTQQTHLLKQIEEGQPRVEIAYTRGVTREGNVRAQELLAQVFTPAAVSWRGVGEVAGSGLKLATRYADFDAERRFTVSPVPLKEHKGCICGEILRAVKTPAQCPLFRRTCTPERPVGPCMVSGEGACASYFLYGEESGG